MELAGDVVLGTTSKSGTAMLLAHGERLTLVYGKSSDDKPVKIIGGYSSDTGRDAPFDGDAHATRDIRHIRQPAIVSMPTKLTAQSADDTYMSSAPLHDVVSVEVFHVPARGISRGLLLRYANGSVRGLGECRVSHDESFVVVDPVAICHRSLQYRAFEREARFDAIVDSVVRRLEMKLEGVAVSVARTTQHSHDEDGWTCHNIGQGVLHFHYTEKHEYAIAYEAEDRFRHAL
ncbi:hypothetical protein SPBR_03228 [Sporothrix brasiliensis 5110]|uniref:Uncharacterized protein n=1 Tax=Sporothrix brasiliensis 5110 TaxID=1398154 RepID=A0A0C2FN75_9PEZI|nr:uncharacterized protein SPBR_03228 [Sporothrix brasiliensis 5110]KIH92478.1 hypothetical protein SPBR_03228 [Sporothrix brasiliensis 5110]